MFSILTSFLHSSIVQGIPLLYGATGEILTEKSGHLNLGIPGIMYVGGISGIVGGYLYEHFCEKPVALLCILIPLVCSLLGSGLMALIYCFLTVTLRANQNVTGLALTTFGTGIGNFLGGSLLSFFGESGSISLLTIGKWYKAYPAFADKLGGFGEVFFSYGFLAYLAVIIALCAQYFLTKTRAGLNLGEGAGYVVLESESSARRRGVKPLCRLAGYGNACDAFHQTASSPDGDGAFLAMSKALAMAEIAPSEIDYINAHGTGTVNNDLSEGVALERIFGKGNVPRMSSTKSFTGHTTSASGGIEAVVSILALRGGFCPANLNLTHPMEELSFAPVSSLVSGLDMHNVLTNAFGFGGNDSSIIFSKVEEMQ